VRGGTATAPLIKEYDMVVFRIEKTAMIGFTSSARPTMQK
jgi:hypothetical protein